MTIAPDNARQGASHLYRAMRDFVEITKEGIVLDRMSPVRPHELTALRLRKRLEKVMPEAIVARKDFVYGEDVTIGDWTISTEGLPRYEAAGDEQQ